MILLLHFIFFKNSQGNHMKMSVRLQGPVLKTLQWLPIMLEIKSIYPDLPSEQRTHSTSCWEGGQVNPQVSAFPVDGLGGRTLLLPRPRFHIQWLINVTMWLGRTLKDHPSSSAPLGLADTFVTTWVQLILSLCPTLNHPSLSKVILRVLLINVPHANFCLRDWFPGTQPRTLTTACWGLHHLHAACLSSLPHSTALDLLLDSIPPVGSFTAPPLEDLCWSTLLALFSWLCPAF